MPRTVNERPRGREGEGWRETLPFPLALLPFFECNHFRVVRGRDFSLLQPPLIADEGFSSVGYSPASIYALDRRDKLALSRTILKQFINSNKFQLLPAEMGHSDNSRAYEYFTCCLMNERRHVRTLFTAAALFVQGRIWKLEKHGRINERRTISIDRIFSYRSAAQNLDKREK